MTDFKEDKDGRKVLSKKGRWGIALLLFSILINVSSDGYKDIQDHKAALIEDQRRDKATADQRKLSEALTKQGSVLDKNLSSVQVLAKSLKETSEKLQRGVVGHLTKVGSFAVMLGLYRSGPDGKIIYAARAEGMMPDEVSDTYWCVQNMGTGFAVVPVAPLYGLNFYIRRTEDGQCTFTAKVYSGLGREEDDSNVKELPISSFNELRGLDREQYFTVKVDAQTFSILNLDSSMSPDAISFNPLSDLRMYFKPNPNLPRTKKTLQELKTELELALPQEIHLVVVPNMEDSEYETTWAFGSREMWYDFYGAYRVVATFKRRRTKPLSNFFGLP